MTTDKSILLAELERIGCSEETIVLQTTTLDLSIATRVGAPKFAHRQIAVTTLPPTHYRHRVRN